MAGKKKRGGPSRKNVSGGPPKKNKKNHKNVDHNKKKKKGPNSTTSTTSPNNNTQPQKNYKAKSSSTQSPPWQLVSHKDMAKNLQAEKERRRLAQQGIHNVKDETGIQKSKSFLSNQDKALMSWKRFAQQPQHDRLEFIGAYLHQQLPPKLGVPEIAFLGRSNVGKSSLLNRLVGSDAARVGKTPGATASVNLYNLVRHNQKANNNNNNNNNKQKSLLGLVDLPGFGYAKLSKGHQESVQQAAEYYLGHRKELCLGILLVDIRRVPSDNDRAVLAALFDMGVPLIVVATKVDKLSTTQQVEDALEVIQKELGLPPGQPFYVSSVTGQGIKELWRIVMETCEAGVEEFRIKMESGEDVPLVEKAYVEEDGDEVAYNQGYDWIHESASVMYEGEEGEDDDDDDYYYNQKEEDVMDAQGDYMDGEDEFSGNVPSLGNPQSFKNLKKKAKDLEKRGKI